MLGPAARFLQGLNLALGITTISNDATPSQERRFVAMWMGILAFMLLWCVLIACWFVSS